LRKSYAIDAVAVESAEKAVRESSMVIAATTAATPIIDGSWLEPGTHVSGIGANTRTKRELNPTCFVGARIVADSREQVLDECGHLRDSVGSGMITSEVVYAELGELAAGLKPGRSHLDEITIFKSFGVALQDIAVAAFLLEIAQRRGLGTELRSHPARHEFVATH
jgi:alanine dehydrogenase